MAHAIDYKIIGDDMQAVVITLDPGEAVHAEADSWLQRIRWRDLNSNNTIG
jgi:uncharacterized protein (AIM24 family)